MDDQLVEVTDTALLPPRLRALGFRLFGLKDESGRSLPRYIAPPMLTVAGGTFLMGSGKESSPEAHNNEGPEHAVNLDTFDIAQYPVTVAEYALFIMATGHYDPLTRNDLSWAQQRQQKMDHPVVNVPWEEAISYAEWLARTTGQPFCLPTEAQWEKAARGIDGRTYPWGNEPNKEYGNIETRSTTPIGQYPRGASPYGAQDMAGNILEWTTSTFLSYPYENDDGRENPGERPKEHEGGCFDNYMPKVLRGGSCDNTLWSARVTRRLPSDIPDWPGEHGFRLARCSGLPYLTRDPCQCGSGLSFRKCHGDSPNAMQSDWKFQIPFDMRNLWTPSRPTTGTAPKRRDWRLVVFGIIVILWQFVFHR